MKKIIKIEPQTCEELKSLDNEIFARKDLLSFMIAQNIDKKLFEFYHKEYIDLAFYYNSLKQNVKVEYVLPEVENASKYEWNIDLNNSEVIISYE